MVPVDGRRFWNAAMIPALTVSPAVISPTHWHEKGELVLPTRQYCMSVLVGAGVGMAVGTLRMMVAT